MKIFYNCIDCGSVLEVDIETDLTQPNRSFKKQVQIQTDMCGPCKEVRMDAMEVERQERIDNLSPWLRWNTKLKY